MGFGLAAFGFLLLCIKDFGLSPVAYGLIAYGFWRVSDELKANRGYKVAAYAAAVAVLPSLAGLYNVVATLAGFPEIPKEALVYFGVPLVLCFVVVCFGYCNETAKIAEDGGAKVFALRAKVTMYLTALFTALFLVGNFMGAEGAVGLIVVFGEYVIYIINALTALACFTTITTEQRKVYEDEIIAEETEKLVRKRIKEKKKAHGEDDDED